MQISSLVSGTPSPDALYEDLLNMVILATTLHVSNAVRGLLVTCSPENNEVRLNSE